MSTVVFLGPSLPLAEARAILDARYLPPARRGDILAAARGHRPETIALIDGYFEQVPSVWHKEILWALDQGIRVCGAASMGALRAAELAQFGMIGAGRVFEAYRAGRFAPFDDPFEDDDEVAVVHGPEDAGYAATDALVDIRATLAAAADAGILDPAERDAIAMAAKAAVLQAAHMGRGARRVRASTHPAILAAGEPCPAEGARRGAAAPAAPRRAAAGRAAAVPLRADHALGGGHGEGRWMTSLDDIFRRRGTPFRLYAQSPVLEGFAEPETVWVSTPRAVIGPGPSDHRMYVIRPDGKQPYGARDLPPLARPRGAAGDALQLRAPSTMWRASDPAFLAVHMFGTVRRVLDVWDCYLGGPVAWPFAASYRRLEMIPHVPWDNAQFGWGYMECGEGADDQGVQRPFALNFDVLAHETGHGLLYALVGMPRLSALTAGFRGFHESAADCVAMLAALHFRRVLARALEDTEGSLYVANELNRIGELSRTRQIRSASNALKMTDVADPETPADEVTGKQVHELGLPLTGAIFDILVEFFLDRLVAARLIARRDADGLRRAAAEGAEDTPAEARCKAAYHADPEGFRAALARARDMTGLRLAAAWRRLDPDGAAFSGVAASFGAADAAISGGRHAQMIRDCFAWRGILAEPAMARGFFRVV